MKVRYDIERVLRLACWDGLSARGPRTRTCLTPSGGSAGCSRKGDQGFPCFAAAAALVMSLLLLASGRADESSAQRYLLHYKFMPGQVIEYSSKQSSVFHTKIQAQNFESTSELQMVKRWKVRSVDENQGVSQIEVSNLSLQMTASDGSKTIEIDSHDPEKQPEEFAPLLSAVGKPLGVVTVSPNGAILATKPLLELEGLNAGLGNLCLPLPEAPVAVGEGWKREYTLSVTRSNQEHKVFNVLQKFTLEKVQGTTATVAYKTVLLNPVEDPQLEVQLAQQLPVGTFELDFERGVMVSHQQELKKSVVGFAGPGTVREFAITFRERLQPKASTAKATP